jgi:rare lipoprotein A
LIVLCALVAPTIAACGGGGLGATVKRAKFGSEYGASSPRVTNDPNPPKGGGRYQVGKPYTVAGRTYVPAEQPGYSATGEASWYGSDFHGRRTANGEIFSANAITGAHPTLPLPSYVRVTNTENGRSLIVRVNDRGPYVSGRIMDLSYRAATMLGYVNSGHAQIKAEYVGQAPLEGDDTRMLMASYSGPADFGGNVQVASNGTNSLADITGQFFSNLFSYADTTPQAQDQAIDSAFDAVNAMASQPSALDAWAESIDADKREIQLGLGVYADANQAIALSQQFALLGSVKEEPVTANGVAATRLTMTYLKPGVDRVDVLDLARQLGLTDITVY